MVRTWSLPGGRWSETLNEQEKWKSAIKVKIKIGNPNKTNASRTATLVRDQNSLCIYDVHIKGEREKWHMHLTWTVLYEKHETVLALPIHVSRLTSSSLLPYSVLNATLSHAPISVLHCYLCIVKLNFGFQIFFETNAKLFLNESWLNYKVEEKLRWF